MKFQDLVREITAAEKRQIVDRLRDLLQQPTFRAENAAYRCEQTTTVVFHPPRHESTKGARGRRASKNCTARLECKENELRLGFELTHFKGRPRIYAETDGRRLTALVAVERAATIRQCGFVCLTGQKQNLEVPLDSVADTAIHVMSVNAADLLEELLQSDQPTEVTTEYRPPAERPGGYGVGRIRRRRHSTSNWWDWTRWVSVRHFAQWTLGLLALYGCYLRFFLVLDCLVQLYIVLLGELDPGIMELTYRWMLIFDRFRDSIIFPALLRLMLVASVVEITRFALVVSVAWKTVVRGASGPFYYVGSLEVILFVWNFFRDDEGTWLMKRLSNTPKDTRYVASSVLTHFYRFLYITLLFTDTHLRSGRRKRRLGASISVCVMVALAVNYSQERWRLDGPPPGYELTMEAVPWYFPRELPQNLTQGYAIMADSLTKIIHFYMIASPRF